MYSEDNTLIDVASLNLMTPSTVIVELPFIPVESTYIAMPSFFGENLG